jgi:hypothetical protein
MPKVWPSLSNDPNLAVITTVAPETSAKRVALTMKASGGYHGAYRKDFGARKSLWCCCWGCCGEQRGDDGEGTEKINARQNQNTRTREVNAKPNYHQRSNDYSPGKPVGNTGRALEACQGICTMDVGVYTPYYLAMRIPKSIL